MANFIGDYTCRLDAKGRVVFPSAFVKQMSPQEEQRFVLKKDIYESCLILYPFAEWERQNKLITANTNPYNKEHSKFLREFFKGTAEIILDSNHRMLLPKRLLDLISCDKEIVLAGQFGKIEVWAKEKYDALGSNEEEFTTLAEKILGGIQTKEQ